MPKKTKPDKNKQKNIIDKYLEANDINSDSNYEGGIENDLLHAIDSDTELPTNIKESSFKNNINETENTSDTESTDEENEIEDEENLDTKSLEGSDSDSNDDYNEKIYKYSDISDIYALNDIKVSIKENIRLEGKDRITKPILTKYERVRLIGERVKHLSLGAKPMIKNTLNMSSRKIAELELKHNVIPIIIVRNVPNGIIEEWKISELKH